MATDTLIPHHSWYEIVSEQTPDMNCIVKELHFVNAIFNVLWDSFHFPIGIDFLKSVNFHHKDLTADNDSEPSVRTHIWWIVLWKSSILVTTYIMYDDMGIAFISLLE